MDIIGDRGEALFRVAITKWCGGKPWFQATFLGAKAEGLDFEVPLLRDRRWFKAIDTAEPVPRDIVNPGSETELDGNLSSVSARSIVVLISR